MSREDGGERDSLAPVIPLFGGPVPERPEPRRAASRSDAADSDEDCAVESDGVPAWHPTWTGASVSSAHGGEGDAVYGALEAADAPPGLEAAEKALLKRLRTRSLSVSEARVLLREHDLDDVSMETVITSLTGYGYLDDAALAEQLVHVGVDRKGQGRQLIAQTLAKRGIPRDIADGALLALPDDDLQRAIEYAKGKVRSLRSLDRETALRRLSGQLARRGYNGSLAMTAARIALDERPEDIGGVRFR
ncbi:MULTISPECIES: regulatory protein RecX [Microbacterium]|uniref:regulatory protein RecX n=1 Tax=Microbacterium TaxID=33882 RepID=UPI00146DDE8B|nr:MULTISPECIES: regulatory protein RecX [Microbacterium]